MLDTRWRAGVERGLRPAGARLRQIGITADQITLLGLAASLACGLAIATGHLGWGAFFLALSGLTDVLDGAWPSRAAPPAPGAPSSTRSATGCPTASSSVAPPGTTPGATRTSPSWPSPWPCFSLLVSYERSRAESLGFNGKGGLMERAERMVVLGVGLTFGYLTVALWLLVGLTAMTVAQRFLLVWRQAGELHLPPEKRTARPELVGHRPRGPDRRVPPGRVAPGQPASGGAVPPRQLAAVGPPAGRGGRPALVGVVAAHPSGPPGRPVSPRGGPQRRPLTAPPPAEPDSPVIPGRVSTSGPAATATYLGYRAGAAVAMALPESLSRPAAALTGRALGVAMRGRRQMLGRHLRRIHGPELEGRALDRAVAATFASYGRYWLEAFRLPPPGPSRPRRDRFRIEGRDLVDKALADGKGVVIGTPAPGELGPRRRLVGRPRLPADHRGGAHRTAGAVRVVLRLPPGAGAGDRAARPGGRFDPPEEAAGRADGRARLRPGPRRQRHRGRVLRGAHDVPGRARHPGAAGRAPPSWPGPTSSRATATSASSGPRSTRPGRGRSRRTSPGSPRPWPAEFETLIRRAPDQWHLLQPNWPSDFAGCSRGEAESRVSL